MSQFGADRHINTIFKNIDKILYKYIWKHMKKSILLKMYTKCSGRFLQLRINSDILVSSITKTTNIVIIYNQTETYKSVL